MTILDLYPDENSPFLKVFARKGVPDNEVWFFSDNRIIVKPLDDD